ncbi:MAG TPA: hypothetical protein VIK94_01805 [Bacilli bacterium]
MSNKSMINNFSELIQFTGLPQVNNIRELLRSNDDCYKLIIQFFNIQDEDSKEFSRAQHTVLAFLLGHYFASISNIDKKIEEYFSSINKTDRKLDFIYLWFLTSYLHDLAFLKEKDVNPDLHFDLSEIFRDEVYLYDYSLYKYFRLDLRFNEILYKRYYEYSVLHKTIDHGIIGGNMIFQQFKNNLINAYIKEKEKDKNVTIDNFNHNDLFFSIYQLDIYRDIAFTIMNHNIRRINNLQIVNQFALYELTEANYPKVNFDKDPLLFLLCLIDIVNPLNFIEVDKYSIEHVLYALTNVFVEVGEKSLVIYLFKLDYLKCIDKWKERLKNASDILDITVEEKYNNHVVIYW